MTHEAEIERSSDPPTDECFAVNVTATATTARLSLRGELDLDAVPILEHHLDAVETRQPRRIIVDATELTFCDSSGIRALLILAAKCAANDREMRLVGVHDAVARVIEITATAEALNLVSPHGNGDRAPH